MTVGEMTDWIEKQNNQELDDWESLGCYHCANYGTHHYNPKECGDCEWFSGIGAWLEREAE